MRNFVRYSFFLFRNNILQLFDLSFQLSWSSFSDISFIIDNFLTSIDRFFSSLKSVH
jgi:hypothetical protein